MTGRGRFIVLEGAEGAGKTTGLVCVRRALDDHGVRVITTREPGGTPLAEAVRELLLQPRDEPVDPLAETLLMFAARAQHVATVIEPALDRGDWVLCDRFTDSTYAYQAGGRGVDGEVVRRLGELVHPRCWPDLTLFLDVPPRTGLARARGDDLFEPDRFEREQLAFFARVRSAYQERAAADPRTVRIDASQSPDRVGEELAAAVARFAASAGCSPRAAAAT